MLAINMCATVESGDEKVVIEKNKCDACINMEHRREIPIYEDIKPYHFVEQTVADEEDKVNKDGFEEVIHNMKADNKEIIYSQITAKVVAPFQPCTEIFI